MSTTRPDSLVIGPFTWTIDYDAGRLAVADKAAHSDRLGYCESRKLLVHVDGDMPEDQVRETLFHEVLHAVIDAHGIACHLEDRSDVHDTEERIVRSLSPALLDVLRRNPKLDAYLTAV